MSKWTKLYEQLLANQNQIIPYREFEGLIHAFGWEHKRTKGSHRHYTHAAVPFV